MGLFSKKIVHDNGVDLRELKLEHAREIERINQDNDLRIEKINHEHKLEMKQKEFELNHFKDEEVKKVKAEKTELIKKLAVAIKENEMQEKLINVNADVVDVKELVNKLINKLPDVNMNIKGLSLQSGPKNG